MGGVAGNLGLQDPLAGLTGGQGARFGEETGEEARERAREAARMAQFELPSVQTGFGGYLIDEQGNIVTQLDPRFAALSGQLQQQAAGAFAQPGGLTPQQQALQSQYTQAAGGALGALGAFSPQEATAEQFRRLEELMAPERERARQAQEARLLAQGRLGSTGGGVEQEALQRAVEQQRLQNYLQSQQAAQQTQQHLAGLGTGLGQSSGAFGQLGSQLQTAQQQRGLAALGAAGQVEQLPLGAFGAGVQLGQARAGAGATGGQFISQAGLQQSGIAGQYGMQERQNIHEIGMKFLGGAGGVG